MILKGTIPSELGNLTNLTELELGGNQLVGCLPSSLREVSSNDFERLGQGFCGDSDSMAAICSGVSGMSDGAARDRKILECLFVSTGGDDWITSTNWNSSAALGEWRGVITDDDGRVTQLYLTGNHLAGPIPPELGYLTNLTVLGLWSNQLKGPVPSELGGLANLTELRLVGQRSYGSDSVGAR